MLRPSAYFKTMLLLLLLFYTAYKSKQNPLSYLFATYKLSLNWMKPENNSLPT